MFRKLLINMTFCLLTSLPTASAFASQGLAIDPVTCLGCHREQISTADYVESVHGKNACTSCHVEITDLVKHMKGETKVHKVVCDRCHKKVSSEYIASVHLQKKVRCADCHTDIHAHKYWNNDKKAVVARCIKCHDKESVFRNSVHGKGVASGNNDSAACHDCHNLHDIKKLIKGDLAEREFHSRVCMKCHADKKLMARNKLSTIAVDSYLSSYHGKNFRLGFPEKVAGCADCHTAHSILAKSDPASNLHPDNLVKMCVKCHPGATTLFAKYYAHGTYDRAKYPALFYTFVAMTTLLIFTFTLFWIHTILWMFRGFVENREKSFELKKEQSHLSISEPHKQYKRFRGIHIFMHLLVITSFLGLSITGLPLKFSSQAWAIYLMNLCGGPAKAALLHRACAAVTFIYFGMALVMSFHFLFIRKDLKGNPLQRLFGPDSLCPNMKDLCDIIGMIKWFFFKGTKPSFERWTYWEKFDFFAVFWGMFAIGGSGLMLWFPEFFGAFLPGWAFNLATIVHSDEALLATGFIFTVHFFNTHGRPEKFPMDFVIFNGQISKEEMIEERGEQWKRYERDGITKEFEATRTSGVLYDFIVKGFGFFAVLTGLLLLFLMIIAFFGGSH